MRLFFYRHNGNSTPKYRRPELFFKTLLKFKFMFSINYADKLIKKSVG